MNVKSFFLHYLSIADSYIVTGCYASYVKYDEMKTAEENANSSTVQENSRHLRSNLFKPVEEQLDEILAMKDTWLAFLIISAVLLVVVLLLLIFLRSRIRIAIALIKEASKWVLKRNLFVIFYTLHKVLQLKLILLIFSHYLGDLGIDGGQ